MLLQVLHFLRNAIEGSKSNVALISFGCHNPVNPCDLEKGLGGTGCASYYTSETLESDNSNYPCGQLRLRPTTFFYLGQFYFGQVRLRTNFVFVCCVVLCCVVLCCVVLCCVVLCCVVM